MARPSDQKNLIRLCTRSVGKHDYVIPMLNSVIERHGLVVVFSGNRLVAMSNFTRAIDGSAWLGMARTDPDFRGRGIAQFMQRKIANYVAKRGIRIMRFWILASNSSSLRAAEKGNFKPVAEATRISTRVKGSLKHDANIKNSDPPINTRPARIDVSKSPYLKKTNGFFCYKYCFAKMNLPVLNSLKHEIYGNRDLRFILSRPTGNYGEFSLLFGPQRDLFRNIITTASSIGIRELAGFVPYHSSLASLSRTYGFKVTRWGMHAIIFEKRIPFG